MEHRANVELITAVVGTRKHAGKVTVIRGTRRYVTCSCGTFLGAALDYIDARKAWAKHKEQA